MVTPEKGCYQWLPSPPRRKTEKSSLTSSVSVWAGKKTAGRCPAPPPGKSPKTSLMVRLEKAVQRAAADWEKQARAEYKKDLYDPERVKVREADRTKTDFARFVLEEWFPICIDNGERKPKTVSFYHDTTKNIVSHFQGQIVQKISAPAIQKFLIYLRTEKNFAPQNVHHHYRTLNMIFAYAVRQELIVKNPMDKVDRPKLARKKVDALSQDEAAAFFAALREQPLDFRCLLHLLITTGIRRGECIGLKWGDLDEKGGTITIQRNVVYTPESGVVVGTPKTAASVRVIPIMQSTLSLLLMLKAQRKRENPGTILADSFIFPGEAGIFEARDPNAVTRRVKRFMKAHGLPDLSPTTCGTAAPPCFWAAERTLRASKRFWATSTPARPSISISRLTCGKCRRPPKN